MLELTSWQMLIDGQSVDSQAGEPFERDRLDKHLSDWFHRSLSSAASRTAATGGRAASRRFSIESGQSRPESIGRASRSLIPSLMR